MFTMDSEAHSEIRGKALTKEETKTLLDFVQSSKVILSKSTNAETNRKKTDEWVRLTNRFNAKATSDRTPQQLRLKWENLKKNARKRSISFRRSQIVKTAGGAPEYIHPDDILDRVSSILGDTVIGLQATFGGDTKPEEITFVGLVGDDSGDGHLSSDECEEAAVPVSLILEGQIPSKNNDMSTSLTFSIDNGIEVPICMPSGDSGNLVVAPTTNSGRSAISTPQLKNKNATTVKKKTEVDYGRTARIARNVALAEYYTAKKKCLDVTFNNILLQNENLKLENEKLKLELEVLKHK